MVRSRRLELPWGLARCHLKAVRLPFRHDRTLVVGIEYQTALFYARVKRFLWSGLIWGINGIRMSLWK